MNWISLNTPEQIEELKTRSFTRPQLIYKHSTRCSISSMVLSRLERAAIPPDIDFYFLDLIRFRALSNQVANEFGVHHESPQVLLIKKGMCTYDESHTMVNMDEIAEQAAELS